MAWLPNKPGCAKSMSAHKSCSAFCTGVPVKRMRHEEFKPRKLFASSEDMFFILEAIENRSEMASEALWDL